MRGAVCLHRRGDGRRKDSSSLGPPCTFRASRGSADAPIEERWPSVWLQLIGHKMWQQIPKASIPPPSGKAPPSLPSWCRGREGGLTVLLVFFVPTSTLPSWRRTTPHGLPFGGGHTSPGAKTHIFPLWRWAAAFWRRPPTHPSAHPIHFPLLRWVGRQQPYGG
jgi:hypothetical protein